MSVQLFHGDCLDVMRGMQDNSIDLGLTDPPYPKLKGNIQYKNNGGVSKAINATKTVGDIWDVDIVWIKELWRVCKYGMIVFCSHHNVEIIRNEIPTEGQSVGLASWFKRNSPPPKQNVPWYEVEYIWYFKKSPGLAWRNLRTHYDIPMLQAGCFSSERILKEGSKQAAHPTQKPVKLIRQLLLCNPSSVLDPFMGTGTTGEAAQNTGIDFIGIEKNAEYFAIAKKRIEAAQLQIPMFTTPAPTVEQSPLWT